MALKYIYVHDHKHLYYSQQEWWKLISNPNKLCKETDYRRKYLLYKIHIKDIPNYTEL